MSQPAETTCPNHVVMPLYGPLDGSYRARWGSGCWTCGWAEMLPDPEPGAVPLRTWAEARGVTYELARSWHRRGRLSTTLIGSRLYLPLTTPVPGGSRERRAMTRDQPSGSEGHPPVAEVHE